MKKKTGKRLVLVGCLLLGHPTRLLLTSLSAMAEVPRATEQTAEQIVWDHRQEALVIYNTLLGKDPHNARALAHRAALYNHIGRDDFAASDATQSIALDSGVARPYAVRPLSNQRIGTADVEAWFAAQGLHAPAAIHT